MVGLVVVSHGRFAEDLVDAARTIVGETDTLEAVSIDWNDEVDEADRRIRQAIARVDRGQGVLVLSDMFGGTPTNLSLSLLEAGKVEIVTGVNLPMLIRHANLRQEVSLTEAAARIAAEGRQSIRVASQLLAAEPHRRDGEAV